MLYTDLIRYYLLEIYLELLFMPEISGYRKKLSQPVLHYKTLLSDKKIREGRQ